MTEDQQSQESLEAASKDATNEWFDAHPKTATGCGCLLVLVVVGAVFGVGSSIFGGDDSQGASAPDEPANSKAVESQEADPASDESQLREAEKVVAAQLPDIPLWEGATFRGVRISDSDVCVDRTFADGKNAGYVVVTFPNGSTGEPTDGTCKNAAPAEPESEPAEVDVPSGFRDDPGLVTRTQFGEAWPLTVDFGALDCRQFSIDGVELQSVTFRVPNMQYAVNGTAKTHSPFAPIDAIWADDPDVAGLKADIGPLIERGLERCD